MYWCRFGGIAIGVAVFVILGFVVWYLLSGTASTKRVSAPQPMLMLPPPPPPPPPPEKPPEPEQPKPEKAVVEPTPSPANESKDPPKDTSDPVTIKGDAQAGSDSFGVQAGSGGGSAGAGSPGGSYSRYVSNVLQQALVKDSRTRHLVFDDIQIEIWLSADGKLTKVQLVRSAGDAKIDELVLAVMRQLGSIDERPPASMRFPMHVSMKGRRP